MNIANTGGTLAPMPNHIAPVDGGTQATPVGPDVDGIDAASPTEAAAADVPFAKVLTQHLVKGHGKDVARDDARGDAQNDANGALPAALVSSSAPSDVAKVENSSKDTKSRAIDDASDDAIANDLASQLALVSLWAGAASQASAHIAVANATGRSSPDSLDIGDKLATARETTSAADAVVDQATAALDARALDVATKRDTKGGLAVASRIDDVKAREGLVAQASGNAARNVETSLVVAQTASAHSLPDASAFNTLTNLTSASVNAATTVATTPAPTPDALRQAVGTPAWNHEVGSAMIRMAVDGLQSAALRLNPEHLGPLDVQVRVDNGVAHFAFQAAHADTRQAIEASRPMLEQIFSEQGLKIGDCAVGDSASRNGGFDADPSRTNAWSRQHGASASASGGESDVEAPAVAVRVVRALGMVDTFA